MPPMQSRLDARVLTANLDRLKEYCEAVYEETGQKPTYGSVLNPFLANLPLREGGKRPRRAGSARPKRGSHNGDGAA